MGAIRKVIKELDPSTENGRTQRELVENLSRLASAKAEFFALRITTDLRTAGSAENLTIPVETVLASVTETHAYSSTSADRIGDSVTKALRSFCSGSKDEIITGVGGLITDGLKTFLGNASASDTTIEKYYVMTEGFSIIRVDLLAWQLDVEATGINDTVQKVSAFVAVKSAVDLTKIKFNTFLSVYSSQLASMNLESQQLRDALHEARGIYHAFVDVPTPVPAPDSLPDSVSVRNRSASALF